LGLPGLRPDGACDNPVFNLKKRPEVKKSGPGVGTKFDKIIVRRSTAFGPRSFDVIKFDPWSFHPRSFNPSLLYRTGTSKPGLPDGLFSNQKSLFETKFQGLIWENVGIFYGRSEYFMNILDIL
jgi:hypothetical protein